MNSVRKFLLLGFALLSCVVILAACSHPPREVTLSSTESRFRFDPYTIQQSINGGQASVFHETQPVTASRPISAILSWNETDFEKVVQAFVSFASKESIDGQLFEMRFQTPCQYAEIGPQLMMFNFFKATHPQGSSRFLRRHLFVDIQTGQLTWGEAELAEVMYEEQPLNRSPSYIPAESALHIAEVSGGVDFRRQLSNKCTVTGYLKSGVADSEWRVGYVPDGLPSSTFEVQVSVKTGEGKIVKTPQP